MSIDNIRNVIYNNIGNSVKVTYNEGRNRVFVYRGKIVEVYNNVFIIFDSDYCCKRCFSFYDVLIKVVKLYFMV